MAVAFFLGFVVIAVLCLWLACASLRTWNTVELDDGDRPGFLLLSAVFAVVGLGAIAGAAMAGGLL